MIAGQLQQLAAILGPLAQRSQQPGALVELIAVETHQQIAGLAVAAPHQLQGLLRRWTEFTAELELLAQFGQQRHRALGGKIIKAQGHQPIAGSTPIWSQQVQLAAQAVAQSQ